MLKMDSKNNKIQVLYKKDCGFCTACKNFAIKRNKNRNLNFIDIHSKKASDIFEKFNLKNDNSTI